MVSKAFSKSTSKSIPGLFCIVVYCNVSYISLILLPIDRPCINNFLSIYTNEGRTFLIFCLDYTNSLMVFLRVPPTEL